MADNHIHILYLAKPRQVQGARLAMCVCACACVRVAMCVCVCVRPAEVVMRGFAQLCRVLDRRHSAKLFCFFHFQTLNYFACVGPGEVVF